MLKAAVLVEPQKRKHKIIKCAILLYNYVEPVLNAIHWSQSGNQLLLSESLGALIPAITISGKIDLEVETRTSDQLNAWSFSTRQSIKTC